MMRRKLRQANNFKVRFTPQLAQATQTIIAKQTRRLIRHDSNIVVASTISPSGSSLTVIIKGDGLLRAEFGNFNHRATPWFSTMKKQIAPAVSGLLSTSLKLKK